MASRWLVTVQAVLSQFVIGEFGEVELRPLLTGDVSGQFRVVHDRGPLIDKLDLRDKTHRIDLIGRNR